MAIQIPRKEMPLHSLSVSLSDAEKIFTRLQVKVGEQAEKELSEVVKPAEQTEAQFQAQKEEIRANVFRITVTISGDEGASLMGDDASVFKSASRPHYVKSIYMTNVTAYRLRTGAPPPDLFELFLDFSKPPLLDSRNVVSSPTPNESKLTVGGTRDTWVAAITDAVLGVLQYRATKRRWLHQAFIYDIGLNIFGIPLGFYACWKASALISTYFASIHTILAAAAYIYVFVLALWSYRILFGYTKWAFPVVELIDNNDQSGKHRAVWLVIILGLTVNVIWELTRL